MPTTDAVPWWRGRILGGEPTFLSQLKDLHGEAFLEKEFLHEKGAVSAAAIPLQAAGEIDGVIVFMTVRQQVSWTADLANQLKIVGDIFWNALRRRRGMEALLASQFVVHEGEERFRLAMNNIASGVYMLDLQGSVTYVNPAAEAMLGYTNAELLGRKKHDVTHYKHPDGTPFPASECPILQVLQKGAELREHEDMFIRKDGSFFPVVCNASPLKNGGETIGIVVGIRDDTQRQEVEQALRESEERFRFVANSAPVMIWMSNVDKVCTYINQPWLEFTGRSLEAEIGSSWADGVHPEDAERCLATYTNAFDRREPFALEYRLRRRDGEYRWIMDSGVPRFSPDGSFIGYIGSAVDVTERKTAEEALQQSEERLRLAMKAGKLVGWDRDVKSGRDSLFGDLRSTFGISSEVFNGRVEDFHRYLHPEDRARVVEAVDHAMHTRTSYAADFRLRWPDGTVRWLTARGKFYYSPDGDPERMLGAAIDITDRKLAEEALRESEERFHLAAQAGRMYAFDWDVTTDAIVRSEASARIFGLSGEPIRLTKQELLARVHPEDQAKFANSLAECTPESPTTQISYRLLRPDASLIWLERTGHAFFDQAGKMVRMIGMVADITDRKRTEDVLRQREAELSEAQRLAQIGSWHWDVKNDIVIWSEELYRIAGRDPSLPAPSYKEHPQLLTPDSWSRLNAAVQSALRSGESYELDLETIHPDGTTRWITARGEAVRSAGGLVVALRGTVQDVTERKWAEEALSAVSQKLIEAQEKERARIARELHDDINQRLALLSVQLDGLKPAEIRSQIHNLTNDIQTLSHGLHPPKLEYLGLAAAAAAFCRELSDQYGLEIDFHAENVPNELSRDVSLALFRVLQEALQNAVKHSGSRHFQVSLKGSADQIILTIQDWGIGFAREEAIKRRGLGLTGMRERMKLVNGDLSIESELQRGTTIHARVPFRSTTKSPRSSRVSSGFNLG